MLVLGCGSGNKYKVKCLHLNLLGYLKCGVEILFLCALAQFVVVDRIRKEVVQQSTESQPIAPGRRKVLDIDIILMIVLD